MPNLQALIMVSAALLLGVLALHYYNRNKRKWEDIQHEMDEAERAFCAEAEREAGLSDPSSNPSNFADSSHDSQSSHNSHSSPSAAPHPIPPSSQAPSFQAALSQAQAPESPALTSPLPLLANPPLAHQSPGDLEQFAVRLRGLGILGAFEGRVEMPAPEPPGLIYRLRDGRTALLLDSLPGERFLAHHAQRFDFILIRGREGKSFSLRRIEDFITEITSA